MLPQRDSLVVAGRALGLDWASRMVQGSVPVQRQTLLHHCHAPTRLLACRASVFDTPGVVYEVAFVEGAVGLAMGGQRLGYQWDDPDTLADLLPAEEALVS